MLQIIFPAIRWTARLAALLVAGVFLSFVLGEFTHPHSGPPTQLREWAGILLLTSATVGIVLAWKWELPGALLSLAALAAFIPVARIHRYDVVAVADIPGVLFLLDWLLRHFGRRVQTIGS